MASRTCRKDFGWEVHSCYSGGVWWPAMLAWAVPGVAVPHSQLCPRGTCIGAGAQPRARTLPAGTGFQSGGSTMCCPCPRDGTALPRPKLMFGGLF